jgi:hypothetical protein
MIQAQMTASGTLWSRSLTAQSILAPPTNRAVESVARTMLVPAWARLELHTLLVRRRSQAKIMARRIAKTVAVITPMKRFAYSEYPKK